MKTKRNIERGGVETVGGENGTRREREREGGNGNGWRRERCKKRER